MQPFQQLRVWQKAHELTLSAYAATSAFPRQEVYGLTSQLRRSCSSIAANLAEGCGRNGNGEFRRFCSIAMGSASEAEYHLLLAKDLKFLTPRDHANLATQVVEVKQMLTAFMRRLQPATDGLEDKRKTTQIRKLKTEN